MLPILLASLLATGSFDNVLVDSTITSPVTPATSPSPSSEGPLQGKTWGLGFRVLGDAPEITIHGALSPRTSFSLQAILRGHAFNEPANDSLKGDSSLFDLELSAPLRTRFACQGKLCATASIGPMLRSSGAKANAATPPGVRARRAAKSATA